MHIEQIDVHQRGRAHEACLFPLILLLTLAACNEPTPTQSTPQDLFPPYPWMTSAPQSQGLDTVLVKTAIDSFKAKASLFALLVVRNGHLVVERYNSSFSQFNDFEIRSAAKSFISALVGIAIREGFIRGVEQRMMEFFPEFDSPDLDRRTREITLEHLLTMRSGIDYTEVADHSNIFNEKTNWLREAINLPMKYNPGERFSYGSVNTNILTAIVAKASRMTAYDFARRYLFDPLQISVRVWDKDPQGYYLGAAGMNFTPRDLARFGYLYLRKGADNSTSIIPAAWVQQSVHPHVKTDFTWGTMRDVNYGYQWWSGGSGGDSLFFASGYGGQFIFVEPEKDMVVVTTANPNVDIRTATEQEDYVLSVLTRYILPAAR